MKTLNSTELDHRFSRKPLVRALALSLGMGLAGSVSAANYVVTNTNDSGAGSLRKAIIDANNNDGPDTIDLSSVSGTITLTSVLEISDDLTINGPGATDLTVSGNDNSRVFFIPKTYLGAADNVEINGITISGGNGDSGGAILSRTSNLTIQDSVITGNKSGSDGAVISSYTADVTLTLRRTEVSDNTASAGGGAIALSGDRATIVIEDSTITGNTAGAGGGGGGIYASGDYSSLTLVRTTISNNKSGQFGGGGIFFGANSSGISLTITDSTISENYSTGHGGGIALSGNNDTTLSISGSTISNNTSKSSVNFGSKGGGVFVIAKQNSSIKVTNSTISDNTAGNGGGGGLLIDTEFSSPQDSDITIIDSTISGNTATKDGGGLSVTGTNSVADVYSSTISGNQAAYGGGVSLSGTDSALGMVNSTVSGNTASHSGGGLTIFGNSTAAIIAHSTVTENQADWNGGGLYGYSAKRIELTHSIISGNSAKNSGADIHNDQGSDLRVANSLLGDGTVGGDGFTDNGNNILNQDPLLGTLADNGGPTLTHLPAPTSPVVDAADSPFVSLDTDQRGTGYPRKAGVGVDLGAVEVQLPTVTLGLSGSPLAENGGEATVTATLSKTWPMDVTVDLGFTGTATGGGTDYTPSASQIIIPANSTSESITLTGVDDGTIEGDETVIVDITGVTNGTEDTTNGEQQQTATITDDDLPSVSLSFVGGTSTLAENGGSVQVQATLSETFNEDVTVTLGYTGTASGSDYTGASQIVIPANSTSESMTLTGVDDGDVEGNETVIIDITGVNNGTEDGAQQITATITDDDEAAPPAAPTNVSVTPGDGALTVNFTPVSGEVSYTATCTPSGGTPVTATGSGSSITVTGLTNGVSYSCSVAVTGYSGVSDAAASAAVAPAAPAPAAPTNVSVTPGDGALTVNFTPVSGETSYTATCTPSGGTPVTATGSGSSVTVTGLTNGVSYSCSVAVTGYSGVSDAAASAAVAPAAPAPASAPTPVPTLGFFAQWLVSMLLGGLGLFGLRRRKKS